MTPLWAAISCALWIAAAPRVEGAVVYQTGFDAAEGYKTNLDLSGQNGWLQDGTGGNGLLAGFFAKAGQQAYVGYAPPATNDYFLFLYQPLNTQLPRIHFSVTMAVTDSINSNYDDFYWSLYNQQVSNLVTLDFDNYELKLYYWLDGTNSRTATGLSFTNGVPYPLTMDLDFPNNRWSATFGGKLLATNQPLTTVGAPLNLGDIDAGWLVYDPAAPGDNYMVFDNYSVTATLPPPQLTVLGSVGGSPALRLTGQPDTTFVIEASTNLSDWMPLKTNKTTGGSFDYVDDGTAAFPSRFYRARWVPN